MCRLVACLAALLCAAAPRALAAPPAVAGDYDTPLGRVRVAGDGTTFTGTLLSPRGACRLAPGTEVLKGTLLDDSLAGQVRLCLTGCADPEAWAGAVLLVGPKALSGAAHVKKGCRAPVLGKNGGLAFQRAPPAGARPAVPGVPTGQARARAREVLRDGAAWLGEGNFEKARKRFLDAIALDGRIPEAFNGVGVTYRMRDDLGSLRDEPAYLALVKARM